MSNIKWNKGSGEILGFCAIVPMLFIMFMVLISALQVGIAKQRMEYAAYSSCRAAVVSSDKDYAKNQANGVAKEYLGSMNCIDSDSVNVNLEVIDTDTTWVKGHFVECTLSADVHTILPFFTNGTKSVSIVMMIENPSD